MICYFLIILSVLSQVIQAEEKCLNEDSLKKKVSEVHEVCKVDLPADKKECGKAYGACVQKEVFLTEPGKYDQFTSVFMEHVNDNIKEKMTPEIEECKKEKENIKFLTCTQSALLKICPAAAESCENLADYGNKLLEKVCG